MEDEGNSKDSQPVPDTVTVKTPGATGPVFRATLKGVFSELWPLAAGAVFGVLIRILFSDEPGGLMSAMAAPFIYFTPFAVGAVTVYAAERTERRSWVYYMGVGALANFFFHHRHNADPYRRIDLHDCYCAAVCCHWRIRWTRYGCGLQGNELAKANGFLRGGSTFTPRSGTSPR